MKETYNKLRGFFSKLGPGFITGCADDDPTAIATYTQAGAQFGYNQLWTTFFAIPFMIVVQEMAGRIGMVTGKGLAGVIRKHYSKPILYVTVFLLVFTNIISIGANLGAMAASAQLILPFPFVFWLLFITCTTILLEVFVSYKIYARYLKYLGFSLLAYVGVAFVVKQDWNMIFYSMLFPVISFDKSYVLSLIAIMGTNISPYLFFWQSDEEVEEEVDHHLIRSMGRGIPKITKSQLFDLRLDTTVGMIFSNVMIFFLCIAAASTLGVHGITDIETPAEAAQALVPIVGPFASYLFAFGILGSGFMALPILAGSASYAISEMLGWKEGLSKTFTQARGFYGVIAFATLFGLCINFTSIQPFRLLIYSAAMNGVLAPILLILILHIGNNKTILGSYVNGPWSNILGWIVIIVMGSASLLLFSYLF